MPDAAMIFAAGFGTRMGALTRTRPKPLIEVAGKPLLDHALALVSDQGVPRVVVNAHYKAAQIESHLAGRPIRVCVEEPEILDTGGGLKAALPHLAEDRVFTLNSDAIWQGENPLCLLDRRWREGMEALLLCVPRRNAVGYTRDGDFALREDGRLVPGTDLVYTGAQILCTERVARHPGTVFSLREIWEALAAENRLHGVVYPGKWCDVGHPEGLDLAEEMLRAANVRD